MLWARTTSAPPSRPHARSAGWEVRRCLAALLAAARSSRSPEVRAAADWAAQVAAGGQKQTPQARGSDASLSSGFRRGVSWWFEGARDGGARSFRELSRLGVSWVSIHTWEPRQRALDAPGFSPANPRFGLRDLPAFVGAAHAAGLRVLYKPHLEMGGFEPRPEEIAILRGPDAQARSASLRTSPGGGTAPRRPAQRDRDAQRAGLESVVRQLPRVHPRARAPGRGRRGRHVLRRP